jgi:peptidoglycan/LPS O-acetylase OafA/YrhL
MIETSIVTPKTRIITLDGVRGVAILLVLLHHGIDASFTVITPGEKIFKLLFATYGWVGVDLFFVLSGYLITGILLDAKGRPSFFSHFYMRRILRIFPVYFITLGFAFIILPLAVPSSRALFPLSELPWFAAYLTNYKHNLISPLGHFWSLCIEEQFYLVWPLLVYYCPPQKLPRLCLLFMAVPLMLRVIGYFSGFSMDVIHFWSIMRIDSLAYGALLVTLARARGLITLRVPARWLAITTGTILVVLYVKTRGFSRCPLTETVGLTVLALFFASMIVLLLTDSNGNPITRAFNAGLLRSLGKYSYAIYIINWPLVVGFRHLCQNSDGLLPRFYGSQVPFAILFCAGTAVLSYLAALSSWQLLEKHCLKLKRHFE